MSPALFCAAISGALKATKIAHMDVYLVAYLDDVFLLGELDKVRAAIATLEGKLGEVGLSLNKKKTSFFSPSRATYERLVHLAAPDQEDRLEGVVHEHGLRILGVPVGIEVGVAEEVLKGRLEETVVQAFRLAYLDPISARALFARCVVPAWTHVHRSGCLLPELKDGVTPHLREVQGAFLEFLTGMRVSALSQAQRQVLDVLGPLSVARGGLGVGLVPADLTREAMCVGGLLDVWPWLARVARDFDLPHLKVALNQWDPAEEVGEGAAAGAGVVPPPPDPLRGRTARLNSLVDTVMTAISKYGRLVQEGKQDNFRIAGFLSPLLPLVPEADVPPRYGMVWDAARTSELLGSPAEKAARVELCGGAIEPWRLEVKDLRA